VEQGGGYSWSFVLEDGLQIAKFAVFCASQNIIPHFSFFIDSGERENPYGFSLGMKASPPPNVQSVVQY
jgi:hypothetical protein